MRGARGGGGVAVLQPLVKCVAVVRLQQQRARAVHGACGDLAEHWTMGGMHQEPQGLAWEAGKHRAQLADGVAVLEGREAAAASAAGAGNRQQTPKGCMHALTFHRPF